MASSRLESLHHLDNTTNLVSARACSNSPLRRRRRPVVDLWLQRQLPPEFKPQYLLRTTITDMDCETSARDILERMLLDASADPTSLPLSLLKSITKDFADEQKIGSGGFATVYKGILSNGTVAVKKLSTIVDMDEKSFTREVTSLARVKHNNVVRFLGYCGVTEMKTLHHEGKVVMADTRERLLCFEFMPNGGLDNYVNDASRGLDWRTRYQIINGICRGLHYLHQQKIVHLDLKPANILLDQHMVPKIADFGLAKCFDDTQTRAMTSKICGSLGYMAPEFFSGNITFKSDIYSFGVIINEILTGKKGDLDIENVLENWRSRFETSEESTWLEHVKLCAELCIKCTDFNAAKRPKASDIMKMLDKIDCSSYDFIETGCTSSGIYENVDALIECVGKNLGYYAGKPVAAVTIYKCLLHWKSFEAERTSVFDRLVQLIGSAIEEDDNNDTLAYWLSNTSSLLFLIQRTLSISRKKTPQPTSLFGRMAQGFLTSSFANMHVEPTSVIRQVEAKYPALLFREQVTAYVEKIYGNVRDNIKKKLSSLISLCIQAPRTIKARTLRASGRLYDQSQSQSIHWVKIIESLDELLRILQDNYVPPVLSQKIFAQMFSYINVQLFNSLLLHRHCCSFSNGEYVKAGLAELELWCAKYAASSWDELKHIRQAAGFLTIFQKSRISYDEIANDLCPILSVQQLYRICTQYWDEKYKTERVSSDVLSNMRVLMTEDSNSADSGSFLLDDDSSIPFSMDDITNSIQEEGFLDVKLAEELLKNPAFQFLHD